MRLVALALFAMSACAGGRPTTLSILTGETLDIILCAAQDEKLSLPVQDVAAAEAYLKALLEAIERGDPDAIREGADLLARVQECLN